MYKHNEMQGVFERTMFPSLQGRGDLKMEILRVAKILESSLEKAEIFTLCAPIFGRPT